MDAWPLCPRPHWYGGCSGAGLRFSWCCAAAVQLLVVSVASRRRRCVVCVVALASWSVGQAAHATCQRCCCMAHCVVSPGGCGPLPGSSLIVLARLHGHSLHLCAVCITLYTLQPLQELPLLTSCGELVALSMGLSWLGRTDGGTTPRGRLCSVGPCHCICRPFKLFVMVPSVAASGCCWPHPLCLHCTCGGH
jgi:hypothetical protein